MKGPQADPSQPTTQRPVDRDALTASRPRPLTPAVFLDRDGVLDQDSLEFIKTPDELHVFPYSPEAVARLNAAGFLVVVITNQSGIGRGLLTPTDLASINAELLEAVRGGGGDIAGIYHCPHLPEDRCECRKPLPGMIVRAAQEHGIDLSRSFLVGDRPDDIAAGAAAGCRTVLVLSGQTADYDALRFRVRPDHVCRDLPEAADWVASQPSVSSSPMPQEPDRAEQ